MKLKKRSSSHIEHFLKTLFNFAWCKIAKDDGPRDQLSRSNVHVDDRDEVTLATHVSGGNENLDGARGLSSKLQVP
jgi:hypothetical protein